LRTARFIAAAISIAATLLVSPAAEATVPAQSVAPVQEGTCNPAYSPCLPIVDDLDCADLSSSQKPVTILEIGIDPYQLDNDWTTATARDGIGCESPIPVTTSTSTTTSVPATTTSPPTTTSAPATTTTPITTTTSPPAQSGQGLARTGADILPFLLFGVVLINGGYLVASSGRRGAKPFTER
jgi:hypothetical protein